MTHSDCIVIIGIALKLQYFYNTPSKIRVDRGSSNFIWQRATAIIVGWLAGRTWKKIPRSIIRNCQYYCEIFISYKLTLYKCGHGPQNTIRRATGWRPMTLTEAAAMEITRKNRALNWNYIYTS